MKWQIDQMFTIKCLGTNIVCLATLYSAFKLQKICNMYLLCPFFPDLQPYPKMTGEIHTHKKLTVYTSETRLLGTSFHTSVHGAVEY